MTGNIKQVSIRRLVLPACRALACALPLFMLTALTGQAAAQNLLTNGDFEDLTGWGDVGTTDNPAYWPSTSATRFNPATQVTGSNAIGGSGTSAFMSDIPTNCDMHQAFVETGPQWSFEFDFASMNPGSSSARSLSGALKIGASQIIYRVNGDGDFQVYGKNSGGWQTPSGLAGAVIFDDNVLTTPLVQHVVFSGDFSTSASVDITVTNSDSTVFSATDVQHWGVNAVPVLGDSISDVSFTTGLAAAPFVLDNVVVTVQTHPGDANGDGMVNLADLQILGDNWQATETKWATADFNGDSIVNLADLQIVGDNWGFGVGADLAFDQALNLVGLSIPEPTSLVLLSMAGLGLLRRHRH